MPEVAITMPTCFFCPLTPPEAPHQWHIWTDMANSVFLEDHHRVHDGEESCSVHGLVQCHFMDRAVWQEAKRRYFGKKQEVGA